MKKNFFFALIFLFEFAKSQTPEKFAPVLNPPSPEAASLGKYGDVPVSYYNGLPEISIPFESIITKSGFELPISVSYYSTGIRIDDMPSLIGMGWSLNAGGAIIRNIRGTDDFSLYGYYNNKQVQGINDIPPCSIGSFLSNSLQKMYDLEPDQFLYNVGNFGGKFVFNENKQCSVNGFKNIKVEVANYSPIIASNNYNIGTITQLEMKISDEKGNVYFFEPSGNEITYNSQSNSTTGNITKSLSSCFLTKIQLNNGEFIQFNYEQNTIKYNSSRNHSHGYLILDNWDTQCDPYIDMTSINITESHTKLLKSISYGNYTVEFEHQLANLDNTEGVKKLISIKYKYNNNIYNSYGLNYLDDFVKERFWLTGIKKFDVSNSSNFIEYKLEYKDPTSLPGRLSSSQDHWGFFNSNPSFRTDPNIPSTFFPLSLGFNVNGNLRWVSHQPDFFGVDRNPDFSKYQIGTLKKIIYPTKGFTEFEFEPNQFEPTPFLALTFGAGLRIKQMRNFSNQNHLSKTTVFEYGLGKLMSEPRYFYNYIMGYTQGIFDKRCVYTKSTSTSVVSLSTSASGGLVGYNEVIVKEVDENGNENGKITYAFINEPSIVATSNSSILGYPNILVNPSLPVTEFSYKNGTLLECNIFKNISGNTSLIKSIKNFYSEKYSTMITASIVGEKDMIFSGNENCTDLYTCRYDIANGFMSLDKVEEYNYENTGFRKNHSWYSYNNSLGGLLLAGVNTNGVYTDYNYLTTNIDNRNPNYRLNILTSKITFKGYNILNHELYDYNNNYQPIKVITKSSQNLGNAAGNISTLENFSEKLFKYSNNLIEKVDEQNGNTESYLWDNNIIKPIAKCVNAELYDVAYTSFENDNAKGRFDYNDSSIDNINSRTGKKAYALINTSKLSASIKSSGTYKFSVWVKNGTSNFSLSLNTDLSGVIINSTPSIEIYPNYEWSLYTYTITKSNDLIANVSLNGNAIIDELRLSPINSEFTTFTYVPYYGITSASDNRGQVTTYEYDGFGKLFRMKDHEGNIINELRYNNKQ